MSNKLMTNEQVDAAMSGLSGKMGEVKSQQAMTRELLKRVLLWTWANDPGVIDYRFSGLNLSRFCFEGLHIEDADFENSDLSFANFRGCDLGECDFSGANLTGVNFSGADFSKVWIFSARCDFSCDLTGVKFRDEKQRARVTKLLTV